MSAIAWGIDPDEAGRLVPPAEAPPLRPVPELDRGEWDRLRAPGTASPPAPDPATAELPDPERWAAALVAACVEALRGARPPQQLIRWMTLELYASISRRAGLAIRVQGRPRRPRHARIRAVRTCEVARGVVEAAVVVDDGTRVRAAALRLEAHRGRWRATALDII
ncbi:hypothetical protein Bcav_1253 [Beutenbergia cavernae DSM 12333]|uniref:Uncharacterized protein n=1 Tax=Beutenbergia cavernae (strain ATCC BAA-8 / DSM 12333 / CCUG 43141 / JCM 11478 / NBRC 16432 / NCIMB 13614 / HKI 0122) TaxID=471853 RepID=C5C1P5_BEUC1|nr:Rv3235 family protein [Beutenbergia cavernae]ACQ79513.1 hypothetical protein Bcav_1253 [Beutenbergia cavernae DSM 12333]